MAVNFRKTKGRVILSIGNKQGRVVRLIEHWDNRLVPIELEAKLASKKV
jgi:hypothetical protein